MKFLVILFLGLVVAGVPYAFAQTAECTTSELDLMCPTGQVLQGITSLGEKVCVSLSPLTTTPVTTPPVTTPTTAPPAPSNKGGWRVTGGICVSSWGTARCGSCAVNNGAKNVVVLAGNDKIHQCF